MTIHRFLNLLALALLVTSLLIFVAFHFLPGPKGEGQGWEVWMQLWVAIRDPENFDEPRVIIAIATFLSFTALVVCSPFLIVIYRRSRLAWWLATIVGGVATLGFWIAILSTSTLEELGQYGVALLAAPAVNLIGLFLIRGHSKESGEVPVGPPMDEKR
jgi:hypothetical protein